ncbi:MAG: acyl carrier protein [Oscillospiraceae bacterium]|jgi:Acyl carrier protein|nr:acyl carrier protein [Oscillospiraceae bacterium]
MFDRLKELIMNELGVDEAQVSMDTDFFNDLHCDSLELIELVNSVEEEFGIEEVPEESLGTFRTVADIVNYLEETVEE